jgi:tripartite-type tricarboxylate transporter receptor subunit TctC
MMVKLIGISFMVMIFFLIGSIQAMAAPEYPTKPISLIVPTVPGGGLDVATRLIAPYAAKVLGKPVNIVYKPGGSNTIGTLEALTAPPDGYTLLVDGHSQSSLMAAAIPNLPFDWQKRTWIGRFCLDPVFYAVNSDSEWKTLADVAAAAKKDPQGFIWGTGGAGGISTISLATFFLAANVPIRETRRVVFTGGAPALTALAGAHIKFAAQQASEVQSLVSAGKIRLIATTLERRSEDFPEVPTTKEAGYPQVNVSGWQGISGPPGLPGHIVNAWVKVLKDSASDPELLDLAKKVGKVISVLGPEATKSLAMKQYEEYCFILTQVGLRK